MRQQTDVTAYVTVGFPMTLINEYDDDCHRVHVCAWPMCNSKEL